LSGYPVIDVSHLGNVHSLVLRGCYNVIDVSELDNVLICVVAIMSVMSVILAMFILLI
jgi:hypothetical protein